MKKYLKSTFDESVIELISMIRSGKITRNSTKVAIKDISDKFPCEFVNSDIVPKKKPWREDTLKQLWNEISISTHEKNNILHMSEIADEVYQPKRTRQNIVIFTTLGIVIVIVAVLLGIRK